MRHTVFYIQNFGKGEYCIMANIKDEAKRILPQIVEWRRHIHAHPELGLETPETEAYIVKALEGMGFSSK